MPRRCAPRNDMLKENRFSGCKNVVRNDMQRLAGCRRLQEPFLAAPWHHLLASATTHLSSACHCEPVRTLAWQSASPQKCLANWLLVGRIRRTAAYSPKVLLSVMLCCKENGLPRRYAPRNDMQKHAACPHRQGRCTRQNCHRLRTFPRVPPPCTRWRVPVFCMSLRTSAHTGVAIRVPAGKGNDKCAFGRIRSIFSYSPKVLLSVMLYCKENGLPRRCAPRNDMLKENRFCGCKNVVRNGMQRLAGCLRVQGCAA